MAKRKTVSDGKSTNGSVDSDDDDTNLLDVEFEWFDPQEIDFHGIKQLLKQLFDVDHELFDLSALSNLIISQPYLGSTVKVADDENEAKKNDPFAFLTVLNLRTHAGKHEVGSLSSYLSTKSLLTPSLASTELPDLLRASPTSSETQIGLILSERFINMPAEISPPMYKMLLEEIAWALEEREPYAFTHYLILSKTYTEVTSSLPDMEDDEEDNDTSGGPPSKKSKKQKRKKSAGAIGETFFFHPEDEIWMRHALAKGDFAYTKETGEGASDAKRAFQEAGIKPMGCMILIEAGKFAQAVKEVDTYIGGSVTT